MNSESSLCTEEQGDEARESLALGVGFQVGTEGKVLEYCGDSC